MSGTFDDRNRQVMPRWLDYQTACALGQLSSSQMQKKALGEFRREQNSEEEWLNTPSITTAAELVGACLATGEYGDNEAKKAASYILKCSANQSLLIRDLAETFIDLCGEQRCSKYTDKVTSQSLSVGKLRKSLSEAPTNPIAWSDLSYLYATAGLQKKAIRAMTVALALGPQNRFVLRNATRCFFHFGDIDYAISILRHSGLCKYDPWIAAAEISVSEKAEKKSLYLDHARVMANNDNLSFLSRSELAAALSTIESKSGANKKANYLARLAMKQPTENSLAQVEWLATARHTEPPKESFLLASFEAQARHLYRLKQYANSLIATEKWVTFQPFSSHPLVLATYLSSVCLNDDQRSVDIINRVPLANRNNPLLINNLAFAYARLGQVKEALNVLRKIDEAYLVDRERLIVKATQGLILFRQGHMTEGRNYYSDTIRGFDKLNDPKAAASAAFFWACEEKRISSDTATGCIEEAKRRIKRAGVWDLEESINKM